MVMLWLFSKPQISITVFVFSVSTPTTYGKKMILIVNVILAETMFGRNPTHYNIESLFSSFCHRVTFSSLGTRGKNVRFYSHAKEYSLVMQNG